MESSYLFYDIETTDINPCFGQVVQFAAIRTDMSLNEIERHELMIRINRDVTPNPEAMRTHGLALKDINRGDNEYEAMQVIHQLMNTPGTISIGYNNLGFDDEFLRFSFYRNLLPPYTHQYANHCRRMDIYPMTLIYYLFQSDVIAWPVDNGQVSLRLEAINDTNRFVAGPSHNAMVDVEATLALARQLYRRQTMWHYLSGYFSKHEDNERLASIEQGIVVDGKLGQKNQFLAPVICLGTHQVYRNQTLWLRLDDQRLAEVTHDSIADMTFAIRKKAGESPVILPSRSRFLKKITKQRLALAKTNFEWLTKQQNLFTAICSYHQQYTYPKIEGVDADAALYLIGFATEEEEAMFCQFHQADPQQKQQLIPYLSNPIRSEQALRILGRHYSDVLNAENKQRFADYLQRIKKDAVIDYKGEVRRACF